MRVQKVSLDNGFPLSLEFPKFSLPCKILQGKEDFDNSRKSGEPLSRDTSRALIPADFAETHLKRNTTFTFPAPCK